MDTIEGIIRRIVREELRAFARPDFVEKLNNPDLKLSGTGKTVWGTRTAILNLLVGYPLGLTSGAAASLLYEPSFGSEDNWKRSVVQAMCDLKKKKLVEGDSLGARTFRYRITELGRSHVPSQNEPSPNLDLIQTKA